MYAPEKEALVWKIRNFPGGKEYLLRCKFGLPQRGGGGGRAGSHAAHPRWLRDPLLYRVWYPGALAAAKLYSLMFACVACEVHH